MIVYDGMSKTATGKHARMSREVQACVTTAYDDVPHRPSRWAVTMASRTGILRKSSSVIFGLLPGPSYRGQSKARLWHGSSESSCGTGSASGSMEVLCIALCDFVVRRSFGKV